MSELFTKLKIPQRPNRPFWTTQEIQILRDLYPTAENTILYQALPNRSQRSICDKALQCGLKRPNNNTRKPEDNRVRKAVEKLPTIPWWISMVAVELIKEEMTQP